MLRTFSSLGISVVAILALFAPLGTSDTQAAELEPVATILDVKGQVLWHPKAETTFHDAHGGEKLLAGALVHTGARAEAHLAWRNGGDFRLLALSELEIPEDEGVRLNAGSVWAQFQHKLLVPFYFQSPSATAVVRGTVLGVELQPQGGTRVSVLEGRVEVSGLHGGLRVMLAPGQGVTVSPFGQMGPVEPVSQRERMFSRRPVAGPEHGPDRTQDHGQDHGPEHGPEHDQRDHGGGHELPPQRGGPFVGVAPNGQVRTGVDWFQHNRAADRLEALRQDVRGDRQPHTDGQPSFRFPPFAPQAGDSQEPPPGDSAGGASPEQAFPYGRRPDGGDHRDHHTVGAPALVPCPPLPQAVQQPIVNGTPPLCAPVTQPGQPAPAPQPAATINSGRGR